MVENVFAKSPVSRALDDARETARSYMEPAPAQDPKSIFEDLARTSRVPVGILMAIGEASGADPAQGMITAKNAAERLAPLIAAGKKPSAALLEALGPQGAEASAKIMERARALADQYYPQPVAATAKAPAPATDGGMGIQDTALGLARGAGRGVGMAVRGLGEGLAYVENTLVRDPINDAARMVTGEPVMPNAPNRLETSAGGWNNLAEKLTPYISEQAKQAAEGSIPSGELFDPSTWSLGDDPSLRGFVMQGADVFGSMVPVIAAAIVSRGKSLELSGAAAGASVGAAQSAGDASENSNATLDQMAANVLPDGRTQLEAESGAYQRHIAEGMSPQAALEATKRDGAQVAATWAAPIGALGGGAVGVLTNPAEKIIAEGANRAVRAGGRAAVGALAEGTTEAAEGIAAAAGSNLGADTSNPVMKDAFGNFVLGALGGGVAGGAAGAMSQRQAPVSDQAPPPVPEQLGPAPLNGLPGPNGFAPEPPPASPKGPFSEAAGKGPQSGTSNFRPGERFYVDPGDGGAPFEAEFVRDTAFGPIIREDDGTETTVPREHLDSGRVRMGRASRGPEGYTAPEDQPGATQPVPEAAPEPEPEPAPAEPFGKRDGSPFPDAKQAARGGMSRLGSNQFTIIAVDGGFMVAPMPPRPVQDPASPATQGSPDVSQPASPSDSVPGDTPDSARSAPAPDAALDPKPAEAPAQAAQPGPTVSQPVASGPAFATADPVPATLKPTAPESSDEPKSSAVLGKVPAVMGGDQQAGGKGPAQVAPIEKPTDPVSQQPGVLPDGAGGPAGHADAIKDGALTDKPKSPGEIWAEHPDRARASHAKTNLVVDRTLPGRQKQGVPMADIKVGKDQNGRFMVRHSAHTGDSGTASPMSGDFATAAEAEAYAAADLRQRAQGVIDAPENGGTSAVSRADAKKVIAWLDANAPKPVGSAQSNQGVGTIIPSPTAPKKVPASAPVRHSQAVKAALKSMFTEAEALRPTPAVNGATPVGSANERKAQQAEAIDSFLRAARSGIAPDDAALIAKADMAEVVSLHNARRKGDVNWQVAKGAYDAQIDQLAQRMKAAGKPATAAADQETIKQTPVPDQSVAPETPPATPINQEKPAPDHATNIAAANDQVNTAPTEGQKAAGNYAKGHLPWNGLDLTLENPKGSERTGTDPDGVAWSVRMPAHYGYFKQTEGADGDHVDFYMGDAHDAARVLVIDQVSLSDKSFDEHKAMIGFKSLKAAREAYVAGFSDGKGAERIGGAKAMTLEEFKAWLASDKTGAPVSDAMIAKSQKKAKKIADFGGQIGGMRKDQAKKFIAGLGGAINARGMNLSEAFPVPDYTLLADNGASADVLSAMALIRGAIGRKPSKSWHLDDWVRKVEQARSVSTAMLDGSMDAETAMKAVKGLNEVHRATFGALRHLQNESHIAWAASNLIVNDRTIKLTDADKDWTKVYYLSPPGAYYSERALRGGHFWLDLSEPNLAEMASRIAHDAELALRPKETVDGQPPEPMQREAKIEFEIRGPRGVGSASIYVTTPRLTKLTDQFPSFGAARAYLKDHQEELIARVRALRKGLNERRDENRHRDGPKWRDGNATEAMFKDQLGFRGVAFGKSITAKEQQEGMNATFDAMMDLAGLLGVPPKALSLNGRIGLGFGTHGTGGKGHWAAVYFQSADPTQDQVIALTRKHGPGTLAHEWWHAVDNFLGRKDAPGSNLSAATTGKDADDRTEFMSDRTHKRYRGALPSETVSAFSDLRQALTGSAWKGRMDKVDRFSKPYFGTIIELAARGFERMVVDELTKRGMINDYLSNIDETGGAYLTTSEFRRSGIGAAFDDAMEAIKAELGVKGQDGPKLPNVNPDLVDKAPTVGTQWEGPNGWREITGYTAHNQIFTVTDKATGQTATIREENIERDMERDAEAISPEGKARAAVAAAIKEAEAKADESKAARNEAEKEEREAGRAEREQVEAEVKAFIASVPNRSSSAIKDQLGKMFNWSERGVLTRAQLIVQIIIEGWKVEQRGSGLALTGKRPDGLTGIFDKSGLTQTGIDFARFYQTRWVRAEAKKASDALMAEIEAEIEAAKPTPFTADDFAALLAEEPETPAKPAPETEAKPFTADDFAALLAEEVPAPTVSPESAAVTIAFVEAFRSGQGFRTIVRARNLAAEAMGRKIDATDYLMIEEAIELAVVKRARQIAAENRSDPVAAYAEMIDLYNNQPILGERTPDKTIFQAYSTPAPLAYLASRLAGIGQTTRVVEPTAGNGMLVMEAVPGNVQANELQGTRFAQLNDVLGGDAGALTRQDAMTLTVAPFDVLIANPPFGKVTDQADQSKKGWPLGVTTTKEIDHAISWHMLAQMPDDGRAVLILGGVKKTLIGDERKKGYGDLAKKSFFKQLYDTYNVVDHFTVAGELYNRQGAAWPVDVIVIDGRIASHRAYPFATAPDVLSTWVEVGRKLNDAPDVETTGRGVDTVDRDPVGSDAEGRGDTGAVSRLAGKPDRQDGGPGDTGRPAAPAAGNGGGRGPRGPRTGSGGGSLGAGQRGAGDGAGPDGSDVAGQSGVDQPGSGGSDQIGGPRDVSDGPVSPAGLTPDEPSWADIGKLFTDGLSDFGKSGKLYSGAAFLEDLYNRLKPAFTAAIRKASAALGQKISDIMNMMRAVIKSLRTEAKMSDAQIAEITPYAVRYAQDVQSGAIDPFAEQKVAPNSAPAPAERVNNEQATAFQVQYTPKSKATFAVGTLVPNGMQAAMTTALNAIETAHGDIDAYVAKELGYTIAEAITGTPATATKEAVPAYFSAEQIDALAMAIKNVSEGKGFIIGDQTGVGKGRFVAAMLRYAAKQGKIPVFVTQKPGLYADMVRDLRDIGMPSAQPEIIATNGVMQPIPINSDDDLFQGATAKELAELNAALHTGKMPKGKKFLFTTYDQMTTTSGKWPMRALALLDAAPKTMLILDESHTAGGGEAAGREKPRMPGDAPRNRAEFFRDLVAASSGSVFSSATYAKNPTVMSLYASTNLSLAVDDIEKLGEAITKGGVPLQQIAANQLTEDGQYVRREKSFAGIQFDPVEMTTDRIHAVEVSAMIGEMAAFDRDTMTDIRSAVREGFESAGFIGTTDGAVGVESTSGAEFASTVHNLVNQFLLAVKLDAAVALAIEAHKRGEKPILTLMNVNSSIIDEYLSDAGLKVGDRAKIPFSAIMDRYLERLRYITVKTIKGDTIRVRISDAQMGADALREMADLKQKIQDLPLEGLTGSPVDAILDRLRAAGVKMDEITGRAMTIADGIVTTRKSTPALNKGRMNDFNSGQIDGLILSASGSTGFSMHAKAASRSNDGRQRHMVFLQAHADINVFMQTLGRVNRTGQSVLPKYSLAFSDLAIEKRSAAVLMKKMASLNANTTAGKRSALTLDVTDFVNEVGDKVMLDYLKADSFLTLRLGLTERVDADSHVDLAKTATGRFIYLHPDETDQHYEAIEAAYNDRVRELDQQGMNPLEAKTLDLQARLISSTVLKEGAGSGSALDQDLTADSMSVRLAGKPHAPEEVKALVIKGLGQHATAAEWLADKQAAMGALMPAHMKNLEDVKADRMTKRDTALKARNDASAALVLASSAVKSARNDVAAKPVAVVEAERVETAARRHFDKQAKALAEAETGLDTINSRIKTEYTAVRNVGDAVGGVSPGSGFKITTADGEVNAVVIAVDTSKLGTNPGAAGRIRVRFAVADGAKEAQYPLSKIMDQTTALVFDRVRAVNDAFLQPFADAQAGRREERMIINGNLIAGIVQFKAQGQVVFYTTADGKTKPGILMPRSFDMAKELADKDVIFTSTDFAAQFIINTPGALLKNTDKNVTLTENGWKRFKVTINVAKGKPYFQLQAVQHLVTGFRQNGKMFQGNVAEGDVKALLDAYSQNLGAGWLADAHKDQARAIMGVTLPSAKPAGPGPKAMKVDGLEADRIPNEADLRKVEADLNAELRRTGLFGKLNLHIAKGFKYQGEGLMGYFLGRTIGASTGGTVSALGILRHEIIHALRSPKLWGNDYGIFTQTEWQTLVAAARANRPLMARIKKAYGDDSAATQIEEGVAESYRLWAADMDSKSALGRVFAKLHAALDAIINALRGNGFTSAAQIFASIRSGEIVGPQDPNPSGPKPKMFGQDGLLAARGADTAKAGPHRLFGAQQIKAMKMGEPVTDTQEQGFVEKLLTQAMSGNTSILGLVPGRPLFVELGRNVMGAKSYLRFKEEMDAMRDEWHFTTDAVAQKWRKLLIRNGAANTAMMELMHDTTLAGIDPTKKLHRRASRRDYDTVAKLRPSNPSYMEAQARIDEDRRRHADYLDLKRRFDAMPAAFQSMFVEVRDTYTRMADTFERTVLDNIEKAMKINLRRAERAHADELRRIDDEGLLGGERRTATEAADAKLDRTKRRLGWGSASRTASLRATFESNRLEGPYFPLTRFGDFFATVRDGDGKVVAFSRFEKVKDRDKFAVVEGQVAGQTVQTGVLSQTEMKTMVDPTFVADIEQMIGDAGVSQEVMDAIWQRWLQTLPEMSVRRNRIHRKGTDGFSTDAFRAFGKHMFHGAHQLARLTYSLEMTDALTEAEREAQRGANPTRDGLIVGELLRRHEYTMDPQGAWWSQMLSSAAFVWYMAMSPAAALTNLTQTTIIGIPVLSTLNPGVGGQAQAAKQLGHAVLDFTRGKGHAADSARLTQEERAAMAEAYRRGTIDKSQSHDLAGVGETGVEYSPVRTRVMGAISYFFHHAERLNREVTFLAAYRMAKLNGIADHKSAIDKAADLTWRTHFDYQNSSRPRIMQGNTARVLLSFKNYQTNMIWRLFRDTYASFANGTPEEKLEARKQLFGVTASMMLHAGISGTWMFSLTMMVAALVFGIGRDDLEEEFKGAVLETLGTRIGGALWYGTLGRALGIDLTARIGMADLWFRSSDRPLEGKAEGQYWLEQMTGAIPQIGFGFLEGAEKIGEGDTDRGIESMVPKAVRDVMKAYRYATEGVTTKSGDPIVDQVPTYDVLVQALGFTPAQNSEQYDLNNRLYNMQTEIQDERSRIVGAAARQLLAGEAISAENIAAIEGFNALHPTYPIGADTVNQSARSRALMRERNESGIALNPRLNDELRSGRPPLVFN